MNRIPYIDKPLRFHHVWYLEYTLPSLLAKLNTDNSVDRSLKIKCIEGYLPRVFSRKMFSKRIGRTLKKKQEVYKIYQNEKNKRSQAISEKRCLPLLHMCVIPSSHQFPQSLPCAASVSTLCDLCTLLCARWAVYYINMCWALYWLCSALYVDMCLVLIGFICFVLCVLQWWSVLCCLLWALCFVWCVWCRARVTDYMQPAIKVSISLRNLCYTE